MRSVWLCSRNDVIGNLAVIAAAALVWMTGIIWLDLLVGTALALLFLQTGVSVLRESRSAISAAKRAAR